MQVHYLHFLLKCIAFQLLLSQVHAQAVYFHQDFQKTTSLVNPQPDTSQFSHIILTAPQLSYHKFFKGYMELTRTHQDSVTGGIIRALRATPFTPAPRALYIQMRLSAESIQSNAVNALYFYLGENFDPVNNSIPGNGLMFGRFAINFSGNSMLIKDSETQALSDPVPAKKQVTLTWVLNNATIPVTYEIDGSPIERQVDPGKYDLWVDDKPVRFGSSGYPGNGAYSKSKLSNFEIRFRNGLGKIRINEILIREIIAEQDNGAFFIMPNPVTGNFFTINSGSFLATSIRLYNSSGSEIPVSVRNVKKRKLEVHLPPGRPAGIYYLTYSGTDGKRRSARVAIK